MMSGVSIIGDFRKKQFLEKTEVEPEPTGVELLSEMVQNIAGTSTKKQQDKVNVIKLGQDKEECDDKMKEHKDNIYSHRILPENFKYNLPKQQGLQKLIKKSKWLNI